MYTSGVIDSDSKFLPIPQLPRHKQHYTLSIKYPVVEMYTCQTCAIVVTVVLQTQSEVLAGNFVLHALNEDFALNLSLCTHSIRPTA